MPATNPSSADPEPPAPGHQVQVWAPRWAILTATVALSILTGLVFLAVGLILDDLSTTGEKFDGLVAGIGGATLGVLAVIITPLLWFVRVGGRIVFWVGMVPFVFLTVVFLPFFGSYGALTGPGRWPFTTGCVVGAFIGWGMFRVARQPQGRLAP